MCTWNSNPPAPPHLFFSFLETMSHCEALPGSEFTRLSKLVSNSHSSVCVCLCLSSGIKDMSHHIKLSI